MIKVTAKRIGKEYRQEDGYPSVVFRVDFSKEKDVVLHLKEEYTKEQLLELVSGIESLLNNN